MFNHAIGANEGTDEAPDRVTVVSKRNLPVTGTSSAVDTNTWLEFTLGGGDCHDFINFEGTGKDVALNVHLIDASETGFAVVEMWPGRCDDRPIEFVQAYPGPTSAPTSVPTSVPTSDPTVWYRLRTFFDWDHP